MHRGRQTATRVGGDRGLLEELYRAAVAAADPSRVTANLLAKVDPPRRGAGAWIFAVGKAAHGMASAAHEWLASAGCSAGGLVVTTELPPAPLNGLEYIVGDHPVPGDRSLAAAERVAFWVTRVTAGDHVYALISGGTSSLIGAPLDESSQDAYRRTFESLLGSGLDIEHMNAARRRISRWADGRLARALRHAVVQPVIISDVMSDDPATVGSGPCTPVVGSDTTTFAHVAAPVVASHDIAVRGALAAAARHGIRAERGAPLTGEAAECGRALATLAAKAARDSDSRTLYISGGETTVTLGEGSGLGGRCQECALAAAEVLATTNGRVPMLVAGTDGRDGPTDAAGAFVTSATWQEIRNAGRDPSADLAAHDAYRALDAVGALFRTGHTGTNMLDIALVLVDPA